MNREYGVIDQALVTVGGKGSKLRQKGIEVPLSKSFIEVEGKPLLFWCLSELLRAEINRFVIAGETKEKLQRAYTIIEDASAGYNLHEVVLFQDNGDGTNGLPYYARYFLDDEFIFEFGHNLSEASHYEEIKSRKTTDVVVYSGFDPTNYSNHITVNVDIQSDVAQECEANNTRPLAIAAPFVLDQPYAAAIPSFDFNFSETVKAQVGKQAAIVIYSRLPIEIDVPIELTKALPVYQQFIRQAHATR